MPEASKGLSKGFEQGIEGFDNYDKGFDEGFKKGFEQGIEGFDNYDKGDKGFSKGDGKDDKGCKRNNTEVDGLE